MTKRVVLVIGVLLTVGGYALLFRNTWDEWVRFLPIYLPYAATIIGSALLVWWWANRA